MKTLVKQLLAFAAIGLGIYLWTAHPRLRVVETGKTPEYPELRARDYGASLESVAKGARKVMADLGGWEVTGEAKGPVGIDLQAVHTHPVFRFKDEVTVTLRREKGRTVVNARSRAVVDMPDLGRQAASLDALLDALDREVF